MLSTPLPPMTSFRLNCRAFFLTYAQADGLSKQDIKAFLDSKRPTEFGFIAQETHENGGIHFHVTFKCERKWDIRAASAFDINIGGRVYHPKIEACRDPTASIRYSRKEDNDPLSWGTLPAEKRKWSEVLDAGTKEEALELVQKVSARDYIINHERIEYYMNQRFKRTLEPYTPRYTVFNNVPFTCQQWLEQRLNEDRPKSLIIYGPSRLGKTEWARSIGRHMYFNGMLDLQIWDDDAEYIILDDWWDWAKLTLYKQFIGAQRTFTLTDKYRKKMTVNFGKPCIVLANELPAFADMNWVRANSFILHAQTQFF